jgi:hypothetical protein
MNLDIINYSTFATLSVAKKTLSVFAQKWNAEDKY